MSLVDYSDLEKEIADAPEPKILPTGSEVRFRIISVREGVSEKNGCGYYMPMFDVPDDPMVVEFNDFFWDLAESSKLEPKQAQRNLYRFKSFAEAIGLDYSRPFSWVDDLPKMEGWAILGVRKSEEYGDSNTIKKYVAHK
jgi:hypothetical protein